MEDEGGLQDHLSGLGATDGRWHHIAVTWRSSDGQVKLYDNGREVGGVGRGVLRCGVLWCAVLRCGVLRCGVKVRCAATVRVF